jgi:hypothetical protein
MRRKFSETTESKYGNGQKFQVCEWSKVKQQRICNEIKFIDFCLQVLRSKSQRLNLKNVSSADVASIIFADPLKQICFFFDNSYSVDIGF